MTNLYKEVIPYYFMPEKDVRRLEVRSFVHRKDALYESSFKSFLNSNTSAKNKKLISQFFEDKLLQGISKASLTTYLYALRKLSAYKKKDFNSFNENELKKFMIHLQNTPNEWGGKFSSVSVWNIMRSIKSLCIWMNKGEMPDNVKWIKRSTNVKAVRKQSAEMLSKDEIKSLLKHCENTRDQAIIAVLYDSGVRAAELMGLKLKDVVFDKLGARISVTGKTGSRDVRLIDSVPYLRNWIDCHPLNDDPTALLWFNQKGHKFEGVNDTTLGRILDRAAENAKLKKRIYPHLFRHSRATELAGKVSEQVLKQFMGWANDSRMASVYVHMNGKMVDDALARAHGLLQDEMVETNPLKPLKCPRCKTLNPAIAKVCSTCSMALTVQSALEFDEQTLNANLMALKMKLLEERLILMEKEQAIA